MEKLAVTSNNESDNKYKNLERSEIQYNFACEDLEKKISQGCFCHKCGDTGLIPMYEYCDIYKRKVFSYKECKCRKSAVVRQTIVKSGLQNEVEKKTFESYKTTTEWQKRIKNNAVEYLKELANGKNYWFYIGGQSGSGKTHICTAIANRFLKKNYNLRYMSWVQDIRAMKFNYSDTSRLFAFKSCDVLYIDDLFKGSSEPSEYDKSIAFEILNYRESNNLITIISSELTDGDLKAIDSAIYGRIKINTTDKFMNSVNLDENKNCRMYGQLRLGDGDCD